jgi:hypothetical protein
MKCLKCKWFTGPRKEFDWDDDNYKDFEGECTKHAPVLIPKHVEMHSSYSRGEFPKRYSIDDACGDLEEYLEEDL